MQDCVTLCQKRNVCEEVDKIQDMGGSGWIMAGLKTDALDGIP